MIYDGTFYKYEMKLFDISNFGLVPGTVRNEDFVPPDPGTLMAAAVAVSRDSQHIYVYYPENTVRTQPDRANELVGTGRLLQPLTLAFLPLAYSRKTVDFFFWMVGDRISKTFPHNNTLISAMDRSNDIPPFPSAANSSARDSSTRWQRGYFPHMPLGVFSACIYP